MIGTASMAVLIDVILDDPAFGIGLHVVFRECRHPPSPRLVTMPVYTSSAVNEAVMACGRSTLIRGPSLPAYEIGGTIGPKKRLVLCRKPFSRILVPAAERVVTRRSRDSIHNASAVFCHS